MLPKEVARNDHREPPGLLSGSCPCGGRISLSGYLLRGAESNAYSGIRSFLAQAGVSSRRPLPRLILEHSTSLTFLEQVGRMTAGSRQHLLERLVEAIPPMEIDCAPDPTTATGRLSINPRVLNWKPSSSMVIAR